MADISKVTIGACQVTHGGVNLGHTLDGVELELTREFEDLTVDAYGSTAVNKALTGQKITAKFKLAEIDANRLNTAIPEAQHAVGGSGERVGIGAQAGYLLRSDAKALVLRPLRNVAGGLDTDDVNIYKAVSVESVTLAYKVDEQRVIEVTMEGLVDETYGDGRLLGHIGSANIS